MAGLRRWLGEAVVPPVGLVAELASTLRARARLARFQQRQRVVRRFPGPFVETEKPRVLAVITHVAGVERTAEVGADRLTRTIDGVLESLGHTELELLVNTMPERHVTAALPEHQRLRLSIREHADLEPMYLGFAAQNEFAARIDDVDWFLYLEDDIVLGDGLLLEKLAYFNRNAPEDALLLPHRYELWRGRKTYIDLMSRESPDLGAWNRLTPIEIDGWRFAEFENPHSGCYFVSRDQLRRWMATGRRWSGVISLAGPRESAATGSLGEAFRLYKPHPANLSFLEVRHWDTAYSERLSARHGIP